MRPTIYGHDTVGVTVTDTVTVGVTVNEMRQDVETKMFKFLYADKFVLFMCLKLHLMSIKSIESKLSSS